MRFFPRLFPLRPNSNPTPPPGPKTSHTKGGATTAPTVRTEPNRYSGPKVTDAERPTAAVPWRIRLGKGHKPRPHRTQNYTGATDTV